MAMKKFEVKYQFIEDAVDSVFSEYSQERGVAIDNPVLQQYREDIMFRMNSFSATSESENSIPEQCYENLDILIDKYDELTVGHPERLQRAQLTEVGERAIDEVIRKNREFVLDLGLMNVEKRYNVSHEVLCGIRDFLDKYYKKKIGRDMIYDLGDYWVMESHIKVRDIMKLDLSKVDKSKIKKRRNTKKGNRNNPPIQKNLRDYWSNFLSNFNIDLDKLC